MKGWSERLGIEGYDQFESTTWSPKVVMSTNWVFDGVCGSNLVLILATDRALERRICSISSPLLSFRWLFQILFLQLISQPIIE